MALRTLAIDYLFLDDRVDNVSYGAPTTLLDYDLVLWNPAKLPGGYARQPADFKGLPSLTDDASASFKRDRERRRREMETFLLLGKTLVMFVPAPAAWFIDSGEREHSGTGRNRATTRILDQSGVRQTLPFDISLVEAAGTKMQLKAGDPFAAFWRVCEGLFYYEAYLDPCVGTPLAVVHGTDLAVATIVRVIESEKKSDAKPGNGSSENPVENPRGKGSLILLPKLVAEEGEDEPPNREDFDSAAEAEDYQDWIANTQQTHKVFLDALFEYVAAERATTGEFSLPEWSEQVRLPAETAAKKSLGGAEKRLASATAKVDKLKGDLGKLRERKLLFAGTGAAFELLVEQAFAALGAEVEAGPAGRADRIVRYRDQVAVVEAKGKGKSASEADAAQLEKWVSEHHLQHGQQPKAILVVNAWRDHPLAKRTKDAFPHQMRGFSEKRDHCLLTGVQLLGAWLDAEANPERKEQILDSIFGCVGPFPDYTDWTAFAEQATDAETVTAEEE